jgi:hypothetical protein
MSEEFTPSNPPIDMSQPQPFEVINKAVQNDSNQALTSMMTRETESVASQKGVGVLFMMLTLIGTRLAGGVVGVPMTTLKLGYVTALCIHIGIVPIGIFSINLLLSVYKMTGRSSLSDIGLY